MRHPWANRLEKVQMSALATITHQAVNLPARACSRFRESIASPSLVGQSSAAVRYAKIQWCIILWRFLALTEVAILMMACPGCYFSSSQALLVLGLGLSYTILYAWIRARTSLAATRPLFAIDVLACMSLMFVSRSVSLVFMMSFYSTTVLLSRPMLRFRQALLPIFCLSLSFTAASALALSSDQASYHSWADITEYGVMFFFWGFAWVLASRIIERAAALELDAHLQEHRRDFRRRLHDDLGNTLCGLHYKIQSLKKTEGGELGRALDFIAGGYARAGRVLDRLLMGLENPASHDSIDDLLRAAQSEFGIEITVAGNTSEVGLSPEVRREVFAVVREAIANSAKHAGNVPVTVEISRRKGLLAITVSDSGTGFDESAAPAVDEGAGYGLRNMRERAEAIGAVLDIHSSPGNGTSVRLVMSATGGGPNGGLVQRGPRGRFLKQLIDGDTYLLLARLKPLVLLLVLVQLLLLDADARRNPWELLITGLIVAEGVLWYAFRARLHAILTRQPWLLIADVSFFCLLYLASWQAGVPVLVEEPASMAIVLSAYFLGISRNVALAAIMAAGLMAASLLVPPDASQQLQRTELVLSEIMDNLVLALLAGFTVEFIRSIDGLRSGAVRTAVDRQRERISVSTHQILHGLVHDLRQDVLSLDRDGEHSAQGLSAGLEETSARLKVRLRSILDSLEQPQAAAGQPGSGEAES